MVRGWPDIRLNVLLISTDGHSGHHSVLCIYFDVGPLRRRNVFFALQWQLVAKRL
jgi:hypothetical protein